MAEPWILVGLGAALMLFGFLSSLVFERWRVPDFLLLILLGVGLGPGGFGLVGDSYAAAVHQIAPAFMAVAVAFLLFEGGVHLPLRGMGGAVAPILGHTLGIMVASVVATWILGTLVFDLSTPASLLFAAATIGPSASIVVSVAPRLRLDPRVQNAVLLESVLANVAAALLVVFLVEATAVGSGGDQPTEVLLDAGGAALLALVAGFVWLRLLRRIPGRSSPYMATLGVLLGLYAFATGFLGGTGTLAAFVFGVVLGNRWLFDPASSREGAAIELDADLNRFHGEITFFVRTFFFIYLGFLFEVSGDARRPLAFAGILALAYLALRWPSTRILGARWKLPRRDRRVMGSTIARGLTDAVLVLYGVQVGLVRPEEAGFLVDAILLLVVVTAAATGLLVLVAERLAARSREPPGELVEFTPVLGPGLAPEEFPAPRTAVPVRRE